LILRLERERRRGAGQWPPERTFVGERSFTCR
jgi:hypothetical protein